VNGLIRVKLSVVDKESGLRIGYAFCFFLLWFFFLTKKKKKKNHFQELTILESMQLHYMDRNK
jgi:hypothetical protein